MGEVTLKRKIYTIEEVRAWRLAYGDPLNKSEILTALFVPFFAAAGLSFSLFYYWWLSLIIGLAAMLYAYLFILPQDEKRDYELNSFYQRNKFINNMTQLLANENNTPISCLKTASSRAEGELKKELTDLQVSLMDAKDDEIKYSYEEFSEKYKNDIMFDLFVEQLATATIEGCSNLDTIKDVKTYHNEIKKKQQKFIQKKKQEVFNFKFLLVISFVLILAISVSFGFQKFIDIYAHSLVGWITNTIYLIFLAVTFLSFRKRLIDDSILEVKL